MIVLDTNVLSEALKPAPSAKVREWMARQAPAGVFVTAITQAEMLYGIEALPAGKRRNALAAAVDAIFGLEFAGRILAFDDSAAPIYSAIIASREKLGRPISQSDAMIGAIARRHGASLATRNVADFEHCGLRIINPWAG